MGRSAAGAFPSDRSDFSGGIPFLEGHLKMTTSLSFIPLNAAFQPIERFATIPAFDSALSGGVPQGAAIMLGGPPGAGKSTLALQIAAAVSGALYFSAEESAEMVLERARRIGVHSSAVKLAIIENANDADDVAAAICERRLVLAIVDSLQTINPHKSRGVAGGLVAQRATAATLIAAARKAGSALIMICHETKARDFAGPRAIEHMVDAAVRLDREPRQLRTIKNRYGAAGFSVKLSMTDRGIGLGEDGAPREIYRPKMPLTDAQEYAEMLLAKYAVN